MNVKLFLKKFMNGTKNAKLSADIHRRLKIFAAKHDLPIGLVVEAACEMALKQPKELRTQAEEHTKTGQQKEPPR